MPSLLASSPMPPPSTLCPTCPTPTSTAFDPWGDFRCLICGEVLWEPITWDASGTATGWRTQTSVTFWRNIPPKLSSSVQGAASRGSVSRM